MGNYASECRLGSFQDADIAGETNDSTSTPGGMLCFFGSDTFVPINWSCKKQTAVSHSSTEAKIISFDDGVRLKGIPPLNLWDLVVDMLRSSRRLDSFGE